MPRYRAAIGEKGGKSCLLAITTDERVALKVLGDAVRAEEIDHGSIWERIAVFDPLNKLPKED